MMRSYTMNSKAAGSGAGAVTLAVMLGVAAAAVQAQGGSGFVPDLLVYEGFDYPGENQNLAGQNGGFGFSAAWVVGGWWQEFQTGRTVFGIGTGTTCNDVGGLEFPGLPTAGSALTRYGPAGQRQANRLLTASVREALTKDNTTIWFSILLGATAQGNCRQGTIIFSNTRMVAGDATSGSSSGNMDGPGQGFGVGLRTDNDGLIADGTGSPNAVAFINSDAATVDVASFTPTLQPGGTHFDTMLVVGKIHWKPNGTPDELYLFNVTDVSLGEPDEAAAIASLTADLDQSTFDQIAIWDTGQSIFDEIRLGTTYASVLGTPAPAVTLIGVR